jgi:hypothetical protein
MPQINVYLKQNIYLDTARNQGPATEYNEDLPQNKRKLPKRAIRCKKPRK